MKHLPLLLGIILLSGFLRFYHISSIPNGLYWDEFDTGYQAYSLLTTGRDYFGNALPLFPHSLSDFRTPVNLYMLAPVIKILGLSAMSVRLSSVLFGILSVFLMYALARQLLKNKNISLIAALVFGLSPWHVLFSRTALDGITLMLFFFLLALVSFLKGLKNINWFVLSGFFFSLTLLSYSPAKLFAPFILLSLLLIYYRQLFSFPKKWLVLFIVSFSLLGVPLYVDSFFGASSTRFHDISVFSDPTLSDQVNQARLQHQIASGAQQAVGMSPSLYDKLISNKAVLVLNLIASNYLKSFSPEFLFIQGDKQLRHSPAPALIGQFQILDFLPLILGVSLLFTRLISTNSGKLLAFWLIASPLPASLTRDGGGHAGRTFFLLPVISILIALGINQIIKKKILLLPYLFFSIIAYVLIYDYFFTFYRVESARAFNYGFSEMISLAQADDGGYDRVIIDAHKENALMAYLFISKYPAQRFSQMLPFNYQPLAGDITGIKVGKLYFLPPGDRHWLDFISAITGKTLLITASDQPLAEKLPVDSVINYPDGSPAYYLVVVNP